MNMTMRFGTWNVRTILQAGNMNIMVEEAERYKMDVVALQEMRWKHKDSIRKLKLILHYSRNDVRQSNRG
jgi:exonuclease III